MENNTWRVSKVDVRGKSVCPMILTKHDELFILEKGSGVLRYRKSQSLDNPANEFLKKLPEKKISSATLGYDSKNDISYLLLGDPLSIFDISNFQKIQEIYPVTSNSRFVGKLDDTPCVQLTNGKMFVPAVLDGTKELDLRTLTWKSVSRIYDELPGNYCKVLCGKKYKFHQGDKNVEVEDISTQVTSRLQLQEPAPIQNGNSVIAYVDGFYYWDAQHGLMKIDTSGHLSKVIGLEYIEDWEQYSRLDGIENIVVNQNGMCALGIPNAGKILLIQRNS